MQDRFVGDIGDFGKYGLLKALCGDDLSLGVVWYLFPDEDRAGDGSHIGYLEPTPKNRSRFRDCDPTLYDALQEIVRDGDRRVRSIRERGVLLPSTTFYEEILSFEGTPGIGPEATRRRTDRRKAWAWDALGATRNCDLVFADPDNGLEPGTVKAHYLKGPKSAYYDELVPYLDRGQSLVIYHHLDRSTRADVQIRARLSQIGERLGRDAFALRYQRGAPRTFFVVPSGAQLETLHDRAKRFVEGLWSQHFTLIGIED